MYLFDRARSRAQTRPATVHKAVLKTTHHPSLSPQFPSSLHPPILAQRARASGCTALRCFLIDRKT
ncbi:hypothetical protein BD413DRAFT_553951 [Trametes elegans]|nr:hypothetical protein BD413DRAFT_553951 [Trametes elegans]